MEFYEDYYEGNKTEYYKEITDSQGHVTLPSTGDELIDKWEYELSQGLIPDLEEGMTPEARKMAEGEKAKAVKKKLYAKAIGDDFNESYSSTYTNPTNKVEESEQLKKLMEYAKSGGMDNLDKAVVGRMLDSLSPDQAQKVLSILKQ